MGCAIGYPRSWSGSQRLRVSCSGHFDRAGLEKKRAQGGSGEYLGFRYWFPPPCLSHRNWPWPSSRSRGPSWLARERLEPPGKAVLSRCPPTATRPLSAGRTTKTVPGRRGSSRAATVSGPSKAASWSALERMDSGLGVAMQGFVSLSSDGNTAIVGGPFDNNVTGAAWVSGSSHAATVSGPSKAASWSARDRLAAAYPPLSLCPPTAARPLSAGRTTTTIPGRRGYT